MKNLSIKLFIIILSEFLLITSCKRSSSVVFNLEKVLANCDGNNYGDGYVIFEISVNNKTNSGIKLTTYNDNYLDSSGFYLMSHKFKTGSIKLKAGPQYRNIEIGPDQGAEIWLYVSEAALSDELNFSLDKQYYINEPGFLSSSDYKISYSPTIKKTYYLQYKRDDKFKIDCKGPYGK